jgi:hypothetical protein
MEDEDDNGVMIVSHTSLTSLYVPDHIDYLDCSHNHLEFLELPSTIRYVNCSHNQIKRITVRDDKHFTDLISLDASHNILESISQLPESILNLNIKGNPSSFTIADMSFMYGCDTKLCQGDFYEFFGILNMCDKLTGYLKYRWEFYGDLISSKDIANMHQEYQEKQSNRVAIYDYNVEQLFQERLKDYRQPSGHTSSTTP